ncbi:hypothetical protein JZO73_04960 [Enterococcus plantarum]|uniref:mersacidin family lantibiotic n=1 Tax=Enterococcus plantarum TaxID=1077675 RepID=UPI001A8FB037|nr:hypothetical protein [Enterococcus plantarum]MBO0466881.1 hypothetical protein [Enterococcus plantarum]
MLNKTALQKVGKSFEELTMEEMKVIQGFGVNNQAYGSNNRACYNWSAKCGQNGYNNSTRLTGCNNNWWF